MKKYKKLILLSMGLLCLIVCFSFAVPAFASMGSTGGGGGGSIGGGASFSSSSSSNESLLDILLVFFFSLLIGVGLAILFVIFMMLYFATTDRLKDIYVHYQYSSDWLRRKEYNHMATLLYQPPNRNQFDQAFKGLKELGFLKEVGKDIEDQGQWEGLKETYIQAQFLYSQLIRRKLVNKYADISSLKKYLDKHYFYKTMVKEIKLKSNWSEVDDTVVNKVEIVQIAQFGGIYVTKIKAWGQDKEIQYNEDFDSSFSRSEWSDYVIFGKNRKSQIKILNLMYGEHAHLNGNDFNNDASLDPDSKYYEKNHNELSEDYYRKLNANKQHINRKNK